MRIVALLHVPFETPGFIDQWAADKGHSMTHYHLYRKDLLPEPTELDLLVVMGGPMNVDEDHSYPWLRLEKAFIREAIFRGKAVLGICLGAQLIARALGAAVYPGTREIGWLPVGRESSAENHPLLSLLPADFCPLHWHGDTFDLPEEATLGATSQGGIVQAFALGSSVLGLQFHLEATPETVKNLLHHCGHELELEGRTQSPAQIREGLKAHQESNQKALVKLLNALDPTKG